MPDMQHTSYRRLLYALSLAETVDVEKRSGVQVTREILCTDIKSEAPDSPAVREAAGRPGLSSAIAIAEGLCLVAGCDSTALLTSVQPAFKRYTDGGGLAGAYGPRIREQVPGALQRLRGHGSRQACMTVWRATDALSDVRDLPCTLSIQWLVRDKSLVQVVSMRSSDAWLGLPYDIIQFSLLQSAAARALGLPAGVLCVRACSSHLYAGDFNAASEYAESLGPPRELPLWARMWQPAAPNLPWERYRSRAQEAVECLLSGANAPWHGPAWDCAIGVIRRAQLRNKDSQKDLSQ